MLASLDTYPPTLPPGFAFAKGEDEFDPTKHLQLEAPERVFTMAELGYTPEETGRFPSRTAAAAPFRMLSDEGVRALRKTIDLCMPLCTTTSEGDPRLYFGAYQSRFLRELGASPDLLDFLGEIYGTPVAGYTMGHLGIQLNMSSQPAAAISPWHYDDVSFVVALSMADLANVEGGRFEFFVGTREEGNRLVQQQGDVPDERCVHPLLAPGDAATIQGSAVWHRAQPLRSEGYRNNVILSFAARDVSYPDGNRTFFTTNHRAVYGIKDGEPDPSMTEWARHAAWTTQARVGTLIEELPWTEDMGWLAQQLRQSIAPMTRAIERLEQGMTESESQLMRDDAAAQMSASRFLPGAAPERLRPQAPKPANRRDSA
jgi:hypothetical protein